ncbi:hypothetical protein D3C73_1295500 [compost metagenome]
MCDSFIGFDQAAQTLAETVFVHFIQRFFVPQTATVRREFVAQNHFTFIQTKLKFEVDQDQTRVIKHFFQHVIGFVGQLFHSCQILFTHPTKRFAIGLVNHWIVHSIVFQEQIKQRRIQFNTFLNA